MRPTIRTARLPRTVILRDELRAAHTAFCKAYAVTNPPPSAQQVAREAQELSQIYNRLSPDAPYGRPELAAARLHFFMPTDLGKVWGPVAELLPLLHLERPEITVLDLGAGSGTGTAAVALLLAAAGYKGRVRAHLVEPDATMSRQLRPTFEALAASCPVTVRQTVDHATIEAWLAGARKDERFDLVLIVNALSEMYPEDAYAQGCRSLFGRLLRERVRKGGFLVAVEPALRRFSRRLSEGTDAFVEAGGTRVAPCLQESCSKLANDKDFCFHADKVPLTPFLQRISSYSSLQRHEVNYAYMTLSPRPVSLPAPEVPDGHLAGRIISFGRRVKKGYNYHVCTPTGVLIAFAPRFLDDGETRGGRLPHGTVVTVQVK